ncbi:proline racemase family protein [Streptomyces cuspidosporus]|uniref:Proline racemase n=1 Tax=Streptomyces cuspidosporus TaxID=66882 RepID=A0ABN3F8I8_9ACTN
MSTDAFPSGHGRLDAVDVHAEGEPGRVMMGSHLRVEGATMAERLQYCEKHLEGLRRLLLREPRRSVHRSQAGRLARAGAVLRTVAQRELRVRHPVNPDIDEIALVMLYEPAPGGGVSGRNTVVLPNGRADQNAPETWTGSLDRSPCGTGTGARMAALHARGALPPHTDFVHESILGTTFTGRLTGTTAVGPYQAVRPAISGRGWITGFHQYVLDPTDPLAEGYTLGDIWGQ